ncbi:LysR family transcriptional regulator [Vibrio parahaemolyticus]|uniref:LysR family transcriptional regulator n=1 Tax=Vibrio parahaemolyticus TaxID=670 RepID=UPI0010DEB9E7|nr:LysR family transcriptional regulator [Vibrio parahaemolyticus]EGQ9521142.1 LysR family transcriptional regulator [Vibrio parahaemolyticus]EGR0933446.1 LysR family transcriptional regulator [Vibrio parahaemolyticus]EGR1344500.1 LysR family transcriptional regulator [Vibrio parahaemolyticus]EHJ9960025.1 LysR family transcriptional regulator [Vibrio parahaemolyticus]EHK0036606.1 LysR family transcriptional regulator [Vibrio parahaemolyticus]
MLNPVWLHTFKTLVEVGHFTQTAEKLYMTQPGVSQHIKKLEQSCQHALIKRENKSFELTEQGRMVYAYALELEEREKSLLEELSFDDAYSGHCKLACSGALALLLYGPLLEQQTQHPSLSIHLEAAPNQSILNGISEGRIDIGIVTDAPNKSLFQSERIGREALCLILPYAYKAEPLTPEILQKCGVIGHPDAEHYMTLFFDQCAEPQLKEIKMSDMPLSGFVNQLSQILLPVSKGLGFTVLPQSAVESFPNREELHVAQLKQTVYEDLYLVKKRGRTLPLRYTTIKEVLSGIIGK